MELSKRSAAPGRVAPAEIDELLVSALLRTDGAAAVSQLCDIGVDRRAVSRRVKSGLLVRYSPGVVGLAASQSQPSQRQRAALLVRPDAALSHFSAATLHAMPTGVRSRDVHLTVTRNGSRRFRHGLLHSSGHLPAQDLATVSGMRLTSAERTLLDLAPKLSERKAIWLGEQLILDRVIDPGVLAACAAGLIRRGRNGSVAWRSLVDALVDGEPVVESRAEAAFLVLLKRADIGSFVTQFQPPWYEGVRGVVDFAWPEQCKIVEVDGRRWHTASQDQLEDRRRDREARRHGWATERFTYEEITRRPTFVSDELAVFLDLTQP